MRKDQSGHIVVETLMSFTLFVFFVISILSLINIVVVQSRIHHALTQTAQTVSMYEYCIHLTGLDDDLRVTAGKAAKTRVEVNEFRKNVQDVFDGISALSGSNDISSAYSSVKGGYESGKKVVDQAKKWGNTLVNNPKEMVSQVLTLALNDAYSAAFAAVAEPIVMRYLSNGSMNGEGYLESMGVFNFSIDPAKSELLDADGNVVLCATYEINFSFGALPLPFDGSLKFEQTVATRAWLGGAGKGYTP